MEDNLTFLARSILSERATTRPKQVGRFPQGRLPRLIDATARHRPSPGFPVPGFPVIVRGAVAWIAAGDLAGLSRLPVGLVLRATSAAQAKTAMQAGSEDLAKVVVECEFDDWAGGAKTALVMADSARGFQGGGRAPSHKGSPCRWAGWGQRVISRRIAPWM